MHNLESVQENNTHKRFWDFKIQQTAAWRGNKVKRDIGTQTLPENKKKTLDLKSEADTTWSCCTCNNTHGIGKITGRIGNKSTSTDHPDYWIIKISQNTEKNPRDLWRLVVTQTLVRNHQLTLV